MAGCVEVSLVQNNFAAGLDFVHRSRSGQRAHSAPKLATGSGCPVGRDVEAAPTAPTRSSTMKSSTAAASTEIAAAWA